MTTPEYGINKDITDSYRRTLEFNNSLLLEQFDKRYEFATEEHIRKMQSTRYQTHLNKPGGEGDIQKYRDSRIRNKEKRRQAYEAKLRANLEPSVHRYAHNIRMMIQGSGEESYI